MIVGPTGAGKSAIALELMVYDASVEIVSADSRQVYIGMDIGTAKPTLEEQERVPHHLINIIQPDALYSAGQYALAAREVLRKAISRGAHPIVVGGSGFYIRALFEGLAAPEVDRNVMRDLEARCESGEYHAIVDELAAVDPVSAEAHSSNNRVKTLRALACFRQTGIPYSEYADAAGLGPFELQPLYVGIAPERNVLYERINKRALLMVEQGLVDETRGLLERGYTSTSPGLRTVGYKEAIQYLAGELEPGGMLSAIQQSTRRYAKRQMTWFRRVDVMAWINPSETAAGDVCRALRERTR